jgi:hypothetical protein
MFFNLTFNIIETLASFIKQNTQQRGKRRREKGPKSKPKTQNPTWVTKGEGKKLFSKEHNCY